MSQNRVQPQSNSEIYSIAGKVFLLGEYAVLAGLPALVATVGPRFRMTVESPGETFHPKSPLGRLQAWAVQMGLPELPFQFHDPLAGAGGFGASTAQFATAYLAYSQRLNDGERRWNQVWKLYRELMSDEPLVPSGADLVAQWQGGVVYFDPTAQMCRDLWPVFDWSQLLVFSATGQAGRKVATHEHLAILNQKGFPQGDPLLIQGLERCLKDGLDAIDQADSIRFGAALNTYAEVLCQHGLEVPATTQDRQELRKIPDVLGIKGAGALQADSILILMKSGSPHRAEVIRLAQQRGLRLVSDGLTCEMGVLCQK